MRVLSKREVVKLVFVIPMMMGAAFIMHERLDYFWAMLLMLWANNIQVSE